MNEPRLATEIGMDGYFVQADLKYSHYAHCAYGLKDIA